MRHDADGRLLEVGARTRTIPPDSTMPRGLSWTRGPPRRGGWGSAWTWAGRSTSCTPWRV